MEHKLAVDDETERRPPQEEEQDEEQQVAAKRGEVAGLDGALVRPEPEDEPQYHQDPEEQADTHDRIIPSRLGSWSGSCSPGTGTTTAGRALAAATRASADVLRAFSPPCS